MNVKCFNCGFIYSNNSCPNCGAPAKLKNNSKTATSYIPNGTTTKQSKKRMSQGMIVALSFLIALAFLLLVGIIVTSNLNRKMAKNAPVISSDVEFIQIATHTTKWNAAEILSILKYCGIDSIDGIEVISGDELLDNTNEEGETAYRISSGGLDNIILHLDDSKSVKTIRCSDITLYDNGSVLSKIND